MVANLTSKRIKGEKQLKLLNVTLAEDIINKEIHRENKTNQKKEMEETKFKSSKENRRDMYV